MPRTSIRRSIEMMMKPKEIDEPTEIDDSSSLHFQAPGQKRKVTFQAQDSLISSSQTEDVDEELCFYTKEDLASFRKRDVKYIQILVTSRSTSLTGDDDTDEVSLIGLQSEREHLQRLKRIREARACVSEEQLSQEKKFFKTHSHLESFHLNSDTISDALSSYSKSSAESARVRGLLVSYHVENLWEDYYNNKSRSTDGHRPSPKFALVRSPGGINVFGRRRVSAIR